MRNDVGGGSRLAREWIASTGRVDGYEGRGLVVLCTRRGCAVYKWVVVEAGQEWVE